MYKNLIIIFSLLFACSLSMLPLPIWFVGWQPTWVLLMLLFWGIYFPQQVNLGVAFLIGLLVDLLTGSLLGEHAFCFVLTLYLALRIQLRLKLSPLAQQSFTIGIFSFIYLLTLFCLKGFQGIFPQYPFYWASIVINVLIWPWLSMILTDLYRRAK